MHPPDGACPINNTGIEPRQRARKTLHPAMEHHCIRVLDDSATSRSGAAQG